MESYIYKTKHGDLGYFQIENGKCYTFPINKPNHHVGVGQWDQYFHLERIGSTTPMSYSLSEQQILEGMKYFVSVNIEKKDTVIVEKVQLSDAGSYFYRTNRGEPLLSHTQVSSHTILDEVRAYDNILESLLEIFRTVEPELKNFDTYGSKIRELLIISCTEVEYLLQKFMSDNNKRAQSKHYNTNDYIWCLPILKLDQYIVSAMFFPGLGKLSPFSKWSSAATTQSLTWYDSYNKVKHDRGGSKEKATLSSLLNSIAAIHILLEAQYGKELFEYNFQHTFRTIFQTQSRPTWLLKDYSLPLLINKKVEWLTQKQHP